MNKFINTLACVALAGAAVSCSGVKDTTVFVSTSLKGPQVTALKKPVQKGSIVIFDGTSLDGWRGYGKDHVPSCWNIDNGALHFSRSNGNEGGDIIFAHRFKNFELELEWKVAKGANSGIFYLAQEITTIDQNANRNLEYIFISAPEYQILDNENHPDAKLGKDNNRKSASLYDMIPANPQNAKPFGEWNKTKIVVDNGTVSHYQNDVKVVEYKLWTPEWTALLQQSKFAEKAWPIAFETLNNCGGPNHEGFIGLQDHGDDVWYRNIRVKVLK